MADTTPTMAISAATTRSIPRSVLVLCCCVAGVVVGTALPGVLPVFVWWMGSCVCALCGVLIRKRWVWALLALGVVLAMTGWTAVRTQQVPSDWMGTWLGDARETLVRVEGVVSERPRAGMMQNGEFAPFTFNARVTRLRLRAHTIVRGDGELVKASGELIVRVRGDVTHLRVGDVIVARGMARRVGVARNPGQAHAQYRAIQDGVAGVLDVAGAGLIEPRGVAGGLYWRVARARSHVMQRAARVLHGVEGDAGVLLRAVLLGQRDAEYEDLSGVYARAGMAHLLAISGLHLGFVVLVLMGVARLIGGGSRWEWLVVCACIGLYVWLMPARVPIVRAGVMAMVLLAGWGFGRRYRVGAVLGWAGVVVVVWRPMDVFAPGMQLSFGVVAGLVVLLGWWEQQQQRTREIGVDQAGAGVWIRRRVGELVVVSLGAQLVSLPLVWAHFGQVHVWSAVGALVITLVFGLLLGVGIVGVVLGMVVPMVSGQVAGVLGSMAGWINGLVGALGTLPGASVSVMPVSVVWAWCVLVVGWWVLTRRGAGAWESWSRRIAMAGVGVWLGAQIWVGLGNGVANHAMVMDTFDVGDGTCHVLRTNGGVIVWDAGSSNVGGADRLVRAMRARGVWRIDTLVLTHANLDHYSFVPALRSAFGIGQIVTTESFVGALHNDVGAMGVLRRELAGVPVRSAAAGDVIEFDDNVVLEVMSPVMGAVFEDVNDSSLVGLVRVPTTQGFKRVLLTGDIEDAGIESVRTSMEQRGVTGIDVLELPHHGSARARAVEFALWLDPPIVVQSTGMSRAWDARWESVRPGREWYSTAEVGAVRVEISKEGGIAVRAVRGRN